MREPTGAPVPARANSGSSFAAGALAFLVSAMLFASPVFALGPKDQNIGLKMNSYAEVACPEELAQGRAGGAGIAQKCVEVKATATNETGKAVKDAGVFGVV